MTDISTLFGRRVLIIEDEVILAMDIEHTLERAGCGIAGVASTLEQSFELLATEEVDFAVLDVNLGGKEVFPLAAKLRVMEIPFFFLTGYSREILIPKEFSDQVCLEKPVHEALLLKIAAQVCSDYSRSRF